MIRAFRSDDLPALLTLWLEGNLTAHSFVPGRYWTERAALVETLLPQAEVYVAEDGGDIQGFVGLTGEYVAGIFVASAYRSGGVGKSLLDFAKRRRQSLTLHVYERNNRAVRFYLREGFRAADRHTDDETGQPELTMMWTRG